MSDAERCDSRYWMPWHDGEYLRCGERRGHRGIHLAPVILNGQRTDIGWRDSEAVREREALSPRNGKAV